MNWPDYELLDFGEGRKLERFGPVVVDRPAPAAGDVPVANPAEWKSADWVFAGSRVGEGKWRRPAPTASRSIQLPCPVNEDSGFCLALDRLPAGQVGVFPEQWTNWCWLYRQITRANKPTRLLNLFGYTGGITLAAALAGSEVTHVDASRPAVNVARENAAISGLAEHPIRWIVEDALKYAEREVKRGARYDAIVLDPPSYGHGPKGQTWQLARDLPKLLRLCRQLTDGTPRLVLLTCHTPGIGPAELSAYLSDGMFGHCGAPAKVEPLSLISAGGRKLPSGIAARWPG